MSHGQQNDDGGMAAFLAEVEAGGHAAQSAALQAFVAEDGHGPAVQESYCCNSCRDRETQGSDAPCEGSCSTQDSPVAGPSGCLTGGCAISTSGMLVEHDNAEALSAHAEVAAAGTQRQHHHFDAELAGVAPTVDEFPFAYSAAELALIGTTGDLVGGAVGAAAAAAAAASAAGAAAAAPPAAGTAPRTTTTTTTTTSSTRTTTPPLNAQDARNWVNAGVGILEGRLAAGDRASEREYLERMAAQQLLDNNNRREFELKLAEINARYGGAPSPSISQVMAEVAAAQQSQQNTGSNLVVPVLAMGAVAGIFALTVSMKK